MNATQKIIETNCCATCDIKEQLLKRYDKFNFTKNATFGYPPTNGLGFFTLSFFQIFMLKLFNRTWLLHMMNIASQTKAIF